MTDKIQLKEKIAAVDQNIRELWDALDDENRKALKNEFFILNRYISNVKVNKKNIQEHFVLTVNEYFNKHWNSLQKHPKLLWLLLCMCNYDGDTVFYHEWLGNKKKTASNNKKIKFLSEIYPNMKTDELELLACISSDKDLKDLALRHGIDDAATLKKLK